MALSKFLYITLADSDGDESPYGIPLTYNGAARNIESLLKIYRITRERNDAAIPTPLTWEVTEVPQTAVDITVTYSSPLGSLSGPPKNVGRYDYTINITLKSNPSYRGYFSTVSGSTVPITPAYDNVVKDSTFMSQVRAQHPDVFPTRSPDKLFEDTIDPTKFLLIKPLPVTITFPSLSVKYDGRPHACPYSTTTKVLDTAASNFGADIPARITYLGQSAPLAAPIEAGTYSVNVTLADFNYVGSADAQYVITPLTVADGVASEKKYRDTLQAMPKESRSWLEENTGLFDEQAQRDFIQNGILTVIDNADPEFLNLDNGLFQQAATIVDCARNLPQKLMIIAAAKLVQLVASYVPGLTIINMLNEALYYLKLAQQVLLLIQFVKDNPYAFANAVLETSGAYAKAGNFVGAGLDKLQAAFPEAGNLGQTIKDVAGNVINLCELVDANSGPVARLIKADNRQTPELIPGFNPPVYRQPAIQKTEYDYLMYHLREPLFKDNEKIRALKENGDEIGLREYVTMLGAVHELAYNYHDDIASTAAPAGLLGDISSTVDQTYNTISSVNGILQGIYGVPSGPTLPSTTTSTAGTVANKFLSGLDRGLNVTAAALTGDVKATLYAFKGKYNSAVKETLDKHPWWTPATVKEFNDRASRVIKEMQSGTQAIRSNPAFARS